MGKQTKFNVYYCDVGFDETVLCECSGHYGVFNCNGNIYLKRYGD